MTTQQFTDFALSLEGTKEKPHFDRTSFRTKRIFATLDVKSTTANLKLTPEDQSTFCGFSEDAIYAVPNKWGTQGWTTLEIEKLSDDLVKDALEIAYRASLKK